MHTHCRAPQPQHHPCHHTHHCHSHRHSVLFATLLTGALCIQAMSASSPSDNGETPPWKRLFHEEQQQEQAQQQQQQAEAVEPEPLTELQQQLQLCYRKTFVVAGFGLLGSMWRWNTVTKHKRKDIFLPPRAQALPEAVVQRYKQKAQFREAVSTVGRQTLLVTGIAGLYFGMELGVGLLRDKQGDWANTAAAGAAAGGLLGSRVPSAMRGRTMAVGTLAGGLMGAVSGWTQQQLSALVAEQEQQQQLQQQTQQQQQQQAEPN